PRPPTRPTRRPDTKVEERGKGGRASAAGQQRGIEQVNKAAIDRGASDDHIKAGDVVRARIEGKLLPRTTQRLTQEQNRAIVLHRDINSTVTQREIGVDVDDFPAGLRAALRQDPDVILIGELRDPGIIDTALKAAETGHLVISTLHTPDAVTTVTRLVAMFPPEEQEILRLRLSEALHAIVAQRLL